MAAVAYGAGQHMGHQEVDQYAGDIYDLQNAVAGIVGLLTRMQSRLAMDQRTVAAERAALELERAAARQDRESAEKTVRAAERAAEALELDAARLRGPRSDGRATTEVPSPVARLRQSALGAQASPVACEPNKLDVPPAPRRAPPLRGTVVAASPRPPPEKPATASMESAPSKADTRYKEPPMPKKAAAVANSAGATMSQARYKEPPMRKAQQPPAQTPQLSVPASPQRSEPAATKVESLAHRDFEDEFDDAKRWAEASAPPGKAPPADSPYYRVMPAPKKTPELDNNVALPPSSASLDGEEDRSASAVAAARSKAPPSQARSKAVGVASAQAAANPSRQAAPPADWTRSGLVPPAAREESEASSVTGSITSLRSRVKAPPMRPAARPLPAAAD